MIVSSRGDLGIIAIKVLFKCFGKITEAKFKEIRALTEGKVL